MESTDTIKSWFWVKSTPEGEAPLNIRNQWIDVPLPLRYDRPIEAPDPISGRQILTKRELYYSDGVEINRLDAVRILEVLEVEEAAAYWADHASRLLVFDMQCGLLVPSRFMWQRFPILEDF